MLIQLGDLPRENLAAEMGDVDRVAVAGANLELSGLWLGLDGLCDLWRYQAPILLALFTSNRQQPATAHGRRAKHRHSARVAWRLTGPGQ